MPVIDRGLSPMLSHAPKVMNTTDKGFINEICDYHNAYRAKHGVGKVETNLHLAKIAQAWANELAKVGTGSLDHNPKSGMGENVFFANGQITAKQVVESWYNQVSMFNWANVISHPGTGDFTQLIWKQTRQIGVAMAECKAGVYVVVNYYPPGNVAKKFPENVLPLKG